jgi:hypothetical protein
MEGKLWIEGLGRWSGWGGRKSIQEDWGKWIRRGELERGGVGRKRSLERD